MKYIVTAVRLIALLSVVASRTALTQDSSVLEASEHLQKIESPRFEIFPHGTLFPSLIASQKEPQLRNSLLKASSSRDLNTLLGLTEQGASIALWRMNWKHRSEKPNLQTTVQSLDDVEFGIQGSAVALFDLESSKWTLLNADYTFSYPLTIRKSNSAVRLRYYHLSSHLGDRYLLLRPDARRFNNAGYRRESVELIAAHSVTLSVHSSVSSVVSMLLRSLRRT